MAVCRAPPTGYLTSVHFGFTKRGDLSISRGWTGESRPSARRRRDRRSLPASSPPQDISPTRTRASRLECLECDFVRDTPPRDSTDCAAAVGACLRQRHAPCDPARGVPHVEGSHIPIARTADVLRVIWTCVESRGPGCVVGQGDGRRTGDGESRADGHPGQDSQSHPVMLCQRTNDGRCNVRDIADASAIAPTAAAAGSWRTRRLASARRLGASQPWRRCRPGTPAAAVVRGLSETHRSTTPNDASSTPDDARSRPSSLGDEASCRPRSVWQRTAAGGLTAGRLRRRVGGTETARPPVVEVERVPTEFAT